MRNEIHIAEQSNVSFAEGFVTFGKIKLNIHTFYTDGVLIDTGPSKLLRALKPFFKKSPMEQVVITHSHEDHIGGAAYLQAKYQVPIYMHESSVRKSEEKADYPLYRQLFWGRRPPFFAQAIAETFVSKSCKWRVIETPGHSADHLVFLNETTGQLFSGDLFVHPRTKVILRNESIPQTINSLEKTLSYDFEEMFCCHAGYLADGKEALREKLDYLMNLEGEVHRLKRRGYSEKEIQARIFQKKYPITFWSFGETDSIHIIRSILQAS